MARSAGPGVLVKQGGIVAVGLALGVGAVAVFSARSRATYQPGTPSISAFPFAPEVPSVPATTPMPAPSLAAEPADAAGAVALFLQALADGRAEQAYPLLDQASRARYSSPAAWGRAQVDRAQPVTFEIGSARPSPDVAGAVEVDVTASHHPSLDAIRGLVPARSSSVWLVRREGDAWRVAADPMSFRPVLPADGAASDAVQGWVNRMSACDTPGAAQFQVAPDLYGPAGLVQTPCHNRGTWTVGAPEGLDKASDPSAFLAAFGPDVASWARVVPVHGPGTQFLAAVAPMGDRWQVMGVAVGP